MENASNIAKAEKGRPAEEDIAVVIERVQKGENQLFWHLVEPHQRHLRSTAHALLRNADDAAEVVQETMLKALRHINQLKGGQCFKGWLMTIAVNEARMRMRKEREQAWPDEDAPDGTAFKPRDFADWHDTPLQTLERKEIREAVHRGLQLLSPRLREVFVLRDIQHYSVQEAASILEISSAKVSLRLHRARLQMREFLGPLFRRPESPWVPLKMMMEMPAMLIHRVVSCKTAVKELSRYIDGELDTRLRRQIDEHLKRCSRCRILLDTTKKLLYLVADEETFLPPFPLRGSL